MKAARKRELSALMTVLQHVAKDPAAYDEPRPLSRAFATVPDMPPSYDVGALIDELARLRLFVVEIRDFDALLVPATSAGAKAERARKPQRKPLSRRYRRAGPRRGETARHHGLGNDRPKPHRALRGNCARLPHNARRRWDHDLERRAGGIHAASRSSVKSLILSAVEAASDEQKGKQDVRDRPSRSSVADGAGIA
jgi:hypothetical protein